MIARVLNLLGVSLGDEVRLMGPKPDNLAGFWEHEAFVQINDEILARAGGSWHHPPQLEPGWESSPEFESLHHRARALVADEFAEVPLWGWKDPRNCLTAPFWRQVVGELRFVIVVRNPSDVATSLAARNGFSDEKASILWTDYVLSSLLNSADQRRLFLFYDSLFEDIGGELQRLTEFVGIAAPAPDSEIYRGIRAAIQDELWHHRTSTLEALTDSRLDFQAKSLYLTLLATFDGLPRSLMSDADIQHTIAEGYARSLAAFRSRPELLQTRLSRALVDLERTNAELAAEREAVAHVEAALAEMRVALSQRDAWIRTQSDHLEALSKELALMRRSWSWRLSEPLRWGYSITHRPARADTPDRGLGKESDRPSPAE